MNDSLWINATLALFFIGLIALDDVLGKKGRILAWVVGIWWLVIIPQWILVYVAIALAGAWQYEVQKRRKEEFRAQANQILGAHPSEASEIVPTPGRQAGAFECADVRTVDQVLLALAEHRDKAGLYFPNAQLSRRERELLADWAQGNSSWRVVLDPNGLILSKFPEHWKA